MQWIIIVYHSLSFGSNNWWLLPHGNKLTYSKISKVSFSHKSVCKFIILSSVFRSLWESCEPSSQEYPWSRELRTKMTKIWICLQNSCNKVEAETHPSKITNWIPWSKSEWIGQEGPKGKKQREIPGCLVLLGSLGLILVDFYQGREHSVKWFWAHAWCVNMTEKQRDLWWWGMSRSIYGFMLVLKWNLFPWAHWRQFSLSALTIFSQPIFLIPGFIMAQGIGHKDCLGKHRTCDCHAHR